VFQTAARKDLVGGLTKETQPGLRRGLAFGLKRGHVLARRGAEHAGTTRVQAGRGLTKGLPGAHASCGAPYERGGPCPRRWLRVVSEDQAGFLEEESEAGPLPGPVSQVGLGEADRAPVPVSQVGRGLAH
jgi:hypothetical protein